MRFLILALMMIPGLARADESCQIGDIECLVRALENSNARWNAILSLKDLAIIRINGKLRETTKPLDTAIPALERQLTSQPAQVQPFAATAILAISPDNLKAVEKLTEAIEHPLRFGPEPDKTYQSAADGLSRAKNMGPRAEKALYSILKSTSDVGRVQHSAAKALIATGHSDGRITEALRSCLKSEHPGVRSAAAREFRNLGRHAEPAVFDLANILTTTDDQNLRLVASGVLADLHETSLPAIPSFVAAINARKSAPDFDYERLGFIGDLIKLGIPESDTAALSLDLDRFGHRIAHLAILHKRKHLFDELLARKPGLIGEFDGLNKTLLHDAASLGRIEFLQTLLAKGANPNAHRNRYGTPLSAAATADEPEAVRVLLKAGADPKIGSMDGTPLERARKYKKMKAVEALTE